MARNTLLVLSILLTSATVAVASAPSWPDEMALRDSLSRVHPRMRASWLEERGIRDEYWQGCIRPVDSGLKCVGRWSYGPSYDVDGRVSPTETLVALARGSGVSLIRFARTDSIELELLADVNAGGLMKRVAVRDSLLYVGSTAGLEIWSISDERNPRQLSVLHTALNDFDVQDSFAYVIGPDDSFKVYNITNAANPVFRGACRDSGYSISVCNGYAYVGDRWGLYIIDARNPGSPNRIGSWGSDIIDVAARNTICCVTTGTSQPDELNFSVLDVTVPGSPSLIGYLANTGGHDTYLMDSLAFVSGYNTGGHQFLILSIADSTQPIVRGSAATQGWKYGVWASATGRTAFVADHWEGLQVFDITNPALPVRDTGGYGAHSAQDIEIDGVKAYVANDMAGLKILDVNDPTRPVQLGSYDSVWQLPAMRSAVARDSFAFVGWGRPKFRTVDVTDPARPGPAGDCYITNPPEDMVLRDSLVYVAEIARFQVVNVARPRQPVLVGSCVAGDLTRAGLVVSDTLAYFIGPFDGLEVFSVADPAVPYLVNTIAEIRAAGCDVVDTLLYVGDYDDSLHIWSFANPRLPYQLSSVYATRSGYGVAVLGRYAYVGCDSRVRVFDVLDPRHPVEVGWCATPYEIRRVVAGSTGVYVCCWEAGVCIFDTFQVGVTETWNDVRRTERPRVLGSVTSGLAEIRFKARQGDAVRASTYDAMGRATMAGARWTVTTGGEQTLVVNLTDVPAGVYLVTLKVSGKASTFRVVKAIRR